MKEGFKVTEVGDIPESWEVKKLQDVCEIAYGKDQKSVLVLDGKYGIYGTGGIMGYSNTFLYDKPSVLIGRKGTIDKPFYLDKPFWTVDTLFYTKVFNNVSPKWLFYVVCSIPLKKYNEATGVPSLNRNSLNAIPIPLPPFREQQKIASILSTVDEKIEDIDAQISQTQQLKKGLMQQLLTKGIGHTKFKTSELGDIPESWEVVKLGDIAYISGGKRLPKGRELVEVKTDHPYIRVADMFMGGVRLKKILYVPNDVFPNIARYTICEGDLFISVAGTLGIVGVIPAELNGANLTENANRISKIKLDRNFLYFVMSSSIIQNVIKKEQTNNAQPKLALARIREFNIPVPSKEEQIKIVLILRNIDEKLQSLQSRKQTYQQLKKGLMQQLLTGKIRVTVPVQEPTPA